MSTAADLSAFEHSVEPATGEVLFSGKKWTYIQDSTSNNGQYSGQIQLNLSTISSQAAFVNWQEAVIQLPVKLQILNGNSGSITSTAAASIDQLVPKCGAWQFIDSVSVVIDGVTVQTNPIHENVNAQLKALTEWMIQDERKYGNTSQFAMDTYDPPISNVAQSLENIATSQFMTSTNNIGEIGLSNTFANTGALERSLPTGVATGSGSLAWDVSGSTANAQSVARSLVYVAQLPARGGFAENLRTNTRAARDTPDTESERRSMEFFNDQFNRDTRAFKTTRLFKADSYGDAKKMAQREALKYVEDYQKRARSDKVNANRVLSPDQEEAATKKVAKRILSGFKRDRKDSVVSAKPDPKRRLFDDAEDAEDAPDDDVEEKMTEKEIRREEELKSQNPGLCSLYQNIAKDQFISNENYDSYAFFKKIKHDFTANVDLRNGHGYFKRHFPQPKPDVSNDRESFSKYKKKLSAAINKAFPVPVPS